MNNCNYGPKWHPSIYSVRKNSGTNGQKNIQTNKRTNGGEKTIVACDYNKEIKH